MCNVQIFFLEQEKVGKLGKGEVAERAGVWEVVCTLWR